MITALLSIIALNIFLCVLLTRLKPIEMKKITTNKWKHINKWIDREVDKGMDGWYIFLVFFVNILIITIRLRREVTHPAATSIPSHIKQIISIHRVVANCRKEFWIPLFHTDFLTIPIEWLVGWSGPAVGCLALFMHKIFWYDNETTSDFSTSPHKM